jgi:hypothetical protein
MIQKQDDSSGPQCDDTQNQKTRDASPETTNARKKRKLDDETTSDDATYESGEIPSLLEQMGKSDEDAIMDDSSEQNADAS